MPSNDKLGLRRKFLISGIAGISQIWSPLSNAQTSKTPAGRKVPQLPDSIAARPSLHKLAELRRDAAQLNRLRSLVVMHEGEVILAEAFSGPSVDTAVNVKSVSKSLLAALTGCALRRSLIPDVTMTLREAIPDLLPKSADPRVASLTLEHLLTMQAGLRRTSGPYYSRWVASDDWVRYVLTQPFVAEPGERMLYSTGDWHVLGAVLSRLGGASLLELSRAWLGQPLGVEFAPWTRDPQGRYMGGNEMSLSPLHMVRVGELYRQLGRWEQTQVLSEQWVTDSFTPRTRSPYSGDEYGYGWFLRRTDTSAFAYARGYGGQFIHVLPAEGIVVAMTSDWRRSARGGIYTEQLHGLVSKHLQHRLAMPDYP